MNGPLQRRRTVMRPLPSARPQPVRCVTPPSVIGDRAGTVSRSIEETPA